MLKLSEYKKIEESKKNPQKIEDRIELAYIKPTSIIEEIERTCKAAKEKKYAAVLIRPDHVIHAKHFLKDSGVKIIVAIAFPNSADSYDRDTVRNRIKEINGASINGSDEIAYMMDYRKLKKSYQSETINKDTKKFEEIYSKTIEELKAVSEVTHKEGMILKIVIETGALSSGEIVTACKICTKVGAEYIMTSSGYLTTDNNVEDKIEKVKLIIDNINDYMSVCVAGGIRTIQDVEKFTPYCSRITTSSVI